MKSTRCNGCGRNDLPTVTYLCSWTDSRQTVERFCATCQWTWKRQLEALGAKLEVIPENAES
jgi:hypothetical protein